MTETATKIQPRLKTKYREEIKGELQKQFEYKNVMEVPGLVKVVVNMGVGEAARDSKVIEGAVRDLTAITGQKPLVSKARNPAQRPHVGVRRPPRHAGTATYP